MLPLQDSPHPPAAFKVGKAVFQQEQRGSACADLPAPHQHAAFTDEASKQGAKVDFKERKIASVGG